MYGARQGTSQARAMACANQLDFIQWGNKRKKMLKNKEDEMHVSLLAKVNKVYVHCEKKLID